MFIAADIDAFKADFAAGLENMLTPTGLGAFILVLANSMQDRELFARLSAPLSQTFAQLRENNPDGPEDDRNVFAALLASGIDALDCWEHCPQEPWERVLNPLRSLRPARVSSDVFREIQQPFDPSKFHFNKPFLRPEILWEGAWSGGQLRVLYNKFPFAPWHLLVVPEPQQCLQQFLTREHHVRMLALVAEQSHSLPGLGMAFNSLGAYASVNQLHFQGFMRETPLPLELPRWQHNGGLEAYPLDCLRTASAQKSWQMIEALHAANQPYNLLYRADACYIVPRQGQGLVALPAWAQGMAWHEICGVFTLPDLAALEGIGAVEIAAQLARLRC
ncbi:MAG: hypothetical protein PHE17_12035 [Thiothrix sp.]|uniref:hypothetical protein n=1 Tax=Thiothrix sp. TaxID=1032 RepID=UPI002625707C|nr:hypothetical protein [Thiothrix sp.]MDD5393739.1 hypothetical protein [Thiothrix sp.]